MDNLAYLRPPTSRLREDRARFTGDTRFKLLDDDHEQGNMGGGGAGGEVGGTGETEDDAQDLQRWGYALFHER